MAVFDPKISLGNLIQIGVVIVTVAGAWFNLDNRVNNNREDLETLQATEKEHYVDLSARTRSLETDRAVTDQKLANILDIVKKNQATLERLARQ